MVDPRIEAVAKAIAAINSANTEWPELKDEIKTKLLSVSALLLQGVDESAWRHAWTAPDNTEIIIGHPEYVKTGYKHSCWFRPEWIGLFFSSASPGKPISPQPTHWQPFPTKPVKIGVSE